MLIQAGARKRFRPFFMWMILGVPPPFRPKAVPPAGSGFPLKFAAPHSRPARS